MEKKSDRTIIDTCKPLIKRSTRLIVRKRKDGHCNVLLVVNAVAFCLSIISTVVFWFTDTYNQVLLQNIVLTNGSMIKEWYFKPPINKLVKVHVFNYTNADRFIDGHDKRLRVEEIGPLVYEEVAEKVNVRYEDSFITFNENRSHIFRPELSLHKSESDVVIVPNIFFLSAIPNINRMGFFAKVGFSTILTATKPTEFENLTLSDYIHGHTDDFMGAISKFKWDFSPRDIGILAQRRGVTKQSLTIDSGAENSSDVGRVVMVGGKRRVDVWKTEKCNRIDANDGVFYGPQRVRHRKPVDVYLPEFCRSLPLKFSKKSLILDNIPAYYYEAPEGTFARDNEHYCELNSAHENHTDGVLEVSDCIPEKPPVFISHPHFMEGDERLFEHIEGLRPNRSLHNSFVYLHPRLSVPLYGVSRMQLNLKVHRYKSYYSGLPEGLLLPLAWVETTTSREIPEKFRLMIYLSSVFANYLEIVIKCGSLLILVISLSVFIAHLIKFVRKNTRV